ncbi:MAG: hypothetical protein U9N14_02555 [Pseudomonadota bacterium]|nr:hypothetical protein [Pseudomonadota bacterium]
MYEDMCVMHESVDARAGFGSYRVLRPIVVEGGHGNDTGFALAADQDYSRRSKADMLAPEHMNITRTYEGCALA